MKTIKDKLQLALEALITINNAIYVNSQQEAAAVYKANEAITALKEALTSVPDWASEAIEQPAPVAKPHEQEPIAYLHQCGKKPELKELSFKKNEPLLAAKGYKAIPLTSPPAQPAPVQEPMAWMFEFPDKRVKPKFDSAPHGGNWQPLYTRPQPDAYGYAKRLAEAIWKKHYQSTAPQWEPFDHLIGVLTQIDNMTSGLTTPQPCPTC